MRFKTCTIILDYMYSYVSYTDQHMIEVASPTRSSSSCIGENADISQHADSTVSLAAQRLQTVQATDCWLYSVTRRSCETLYPGRVHSYSTDKTRRTVDAPLPVQIERAFPGCTKLYRVNSASRVMGPTQVSANC